MHDFCLILFLLLFIPNINLSARMENSTKIVDIGTLGGSYSYAHAISADGKVVVGESYLADDRTCRAFKYSNGLMIDIGTLGGTTASAAAVSSDGSTIVGYSYPTGNQTVSAFKYSNGVMTDLGSLGGTFTYVTGVSADGSIVIGYSDLPQDTAHHAFKYSNGVMTDIGTLGGSTSVANAVSGDGNVIVGQSGINSGYSHAFKYVNGVMSDIGTLGGLTSSAKAVSGDGSVIVGASLYCPNAYNHAFKYINGVMSDLGTFGGRESYALGVSSDGKTIVGYASLVDETKHAFIYRVNMVDVDNTVSSIARNASEMNSVLNLKSALLANALNSDCSMYGTMGVCLSLSGWHYSSQGTDIAAQSASTLKAAYRFNKMFRAGVLVDLAFSSANPGNFKVDRTPLFGVFANIGDNETGNGLQFKLAAAYNSAHANITRTVMENTEPGNGDSRFRSFGAKAELSWKKPLPLFDMTPHIGIQWTDVVRIGYTETSGATFPVVYNDIANRQLTAIAGLKGDRKLSSSLDVGADAEQDLHSAMGAYNGIMDVLGPFNLVSPNVTNTRPFAVVMANYDLGGLRKIGVEFAAHRQSLGTAYGTLVSGQYTVAF